MEIMKPGGAGFILEEEGGGDGGLEGDEEGGSTEAFLRQFLYPQF